MNERAMAGTMPASMQTRVDTRAPGSAVSGSAVSWGAVFAGAAAAAALSLILLVLGTGLGLSSVSPFAGRGLGGTAFGWSTILWVTLTQLAASGLGGYLAGRLRAQWAATDGDEIYFRDTAHGFLAWAVATIVTAATLTSAIGSIVGGGAQAVGSVASGAATTAATAVAARTDGAGSSDYFVDSLFRANVAGAADTAASGATPSGEAQAATQGGAGASSAEVGRIFANALVSGALPQDDAAYVAQLVAKRTGVSAADAQRRVNDTFARMQASADKARKASAYAALWLFISLLAGAFVASYFATFGGRRRDLI